MPCVYHSAGYNYLESNNLHYFRYLAVGLVEPRGIDTISVTTSDHLTFPAQGLRNVSPLCRTHAG